jgi:hypothetical protein
MAHAERPGAEPRDRAAGLERLARGLGAVEDFEPVALRIGEHHEILDAAFVRKRARAARRLDAGRFQPCRESFERGGVAYLPAEERDTFAAVFADDHALLAIIHAQRQALAAALDELHPQKTGAEGSPILERFCANTDIAESLNVHGRPPSEFNQSKSMSFPDELGKFPAAIPGLVLVYLEPRRRGA